jgi:glyoxylase-like metal-dependent hydrolase (beta-lactamase superfamily II)
MEKVVDPGSALMLSGSSMGCLPKILMIPLPGHSRGHAGVAVGKPGGWILNAADAYFYRHELDSKPHTTAGVRLYQRLMEVDYKQRLDNQARLRELVRWQRGVSVFCSHDDTELEQLRHASKDWQISREHTRRVNAVRKVS